MNMALPRPYILGFVRDLLINIVGVIVLLGLTGCVYYLGAAMLAVVLGALAVSCWCLARWCRQADSRQPEPGTAYVLKGRFIVPSRWLRRVLVRLSYGLLASVVFIMVISAIRMQIEQRQREAELGQSIGKMVAEFEKLEAADMPGVLEEVKKILGGMAEKAVKDGDDDALQALQTGDPGRVQSYLVERRNHSRRGLKDREKSLIQGNVAVATIALLRGDHPTFSDALAEIQEYDPDNPTAMNLWGQLQFRLGELKKAEESFTRLLQLGQDDLRIMASAHANLGVVAYSRSDYPLARTHYDQALNLLRKLGDMHGQGSLLGNLGVVEKTLGNLPNAEQYLREAIKIDRALQNRKSLADHTNNLGDLLSITGRRDEAETMLTESVRISCDIGFREGIAKAKGNLGLLYSDMSRLDEAEQAHQEAMQMNRELGRPQGIAVCYGNLGLVELKRGHPEAARQYFLDALTIFTDLDSPEGIANQYANLGIADEELGNPAEARNWWGMAKFLYEEIGDDRMAKQMQEWLDSL